MKTARGMVDTTSLKITSRGHLKQLGSPKIFDVSFFFNTNILFVVTVKGSEMFLHLKPQLEVEDEIHDWDCLDARGLLAISSQKLVYCYSFRVSLQNAAHRRSLTLTSGNRRKPHVLGSLE